MARRVGKRRLSTTNGHEWTRIIRGKEEDCVAFLCASAVGKGGLNAERLLVLRIAQFLDGNQIQDADD